MLLNDFDLLKRITAQKKNLQNDRRRGNPSNLKEVDRLFNSSLVITESSTTYLEHEYISSQRKTNSTSTRTSPNKILKKSTPDSQDDNPNRDEEKLNASNSTQSFGPDGEINYLSDKELDKEKSLFRHQKVYKRSLPQPVTSVLTKEMRDFEEKMDGLDIFTNTGRKSMMKGINLIIYLPDFNPMPIVASESSDFGEVIRIALAQHRRQDRKPKLLYDRPECYELRQHDEDGQPDRDFPPLQPDQQLRYFNLDEYCLCEVASMMAGMSIPKSNSMFNISRNSAYSPSDDNNLDSNITFIVFPDGVEIEVDQDAESTMLSLLPKIAKTHRLRLHRNEYEFHVSEEDQQKLMLASPIIDLHQKVKDVPTNTFYIRKKVSSVQSS